jgi:DNA adenine methylase
MTEFAQQFTFEFNAEPILKWAGGKQIVASTLVKYFPDDYNRYFEPFVGGCSVALQVDSHPPVLNDQNEWLIDTYEAVRDDWRQVANILDSLVNTEAEFYRIRSLDHWTLDRYTRAAHLIYLNKTCFRGLFRVNKNNRFNVPYGGYNRRYYDAVNLAAFSSFLQRCELRCTDFEVALYDATPEDFIYFDPPYHRIGGYSDFNRYTSSKFKEVDHIRLRNLCHELDERGVHWVQSNSSTKFIRELYKGFNIEEITNRREINLNSKSRDITELIVKNF